ncbi:MAG: hypothetical protein CVU22_12245 [Betaproteobacteria bacterium HGW-Betaproteobacteria-16]|nr:MAG: hypothetical protein CVU22_12245 [Betaproteobacteria bacterium HGW-Betaproteobacteria-16]
MPAGQVRLCGKRTPFVPSLPSASAGEVFRVTAGQAHAVAAASQATLVIIDQWRPTHAAT